MDHVVGPLHILLAEKEGRIWFNIMCLKLYPFGRITWWYSFVLESVVQSIMEFSLQFILKSVLLEKNMNKASLLNLRQAHLLEVGLTKILGDHETLSIVHHVGLHVDFSSMKFSLGL
jgi:hypothetical protein